ncbi:THOC2 [Cordylochernes scorpioides]|uniref:THOC2 n=1 Tax=Cordylochernes scorpioides TaxID=51811 RepID=A0ABY6K5H2_9ARAC|nr:THOC2 [Cordylochernes scorpioides]
MICDVGADVETLCVDDKTHRDRYFTLVNNCSKQKIVTDYLLKERMEFDTLIECLSSFKNSAVAKFIKVKTRLFYKQQKFNLFREESEGYAKLVAELNQDIGESMSCEQMLQIVTSLIGCFNLDPNRVLDVILESLECHLDRADFYVGLIRLFLPDVATVSQLVAFRYGWYRDSEETPESLHQLAAVLLQHKLLPLDQIFHQLAPSATEMAAQHKQDLQEARAAAKKLSSTMLVSEEEAAAAASQGPEESGEIGSLGSGGNTNNQKVGLCAALIELGVWETAEKMISQMPEHYATGHSIIAQRLSSLLHYTIDPVYIK